MANMRIGPPCGIPACASVASICAFNGRPELSPNLPGSKPNRLKRPTPSVFSCQGPLSSSRVDEQHEDAVGELVLAGLHPGVAHQARIEAGREVGVCDRHAAAPTGSAAGVTWIRPLLSATAQGRRTPPSCSAIARPGLQGVLVEAVAWK